MLVYTSTTTVESKERLYRQLYYSGFGAKELDAYFHGSEVYYGYAAGMFGFDRTIDGLNSSAQPITKQERNDEMRSYISYVESFDRAQASSPRLSYVVTAIGEESALSNLDRWYERDAGEKIGKFMCYRVKLREEKLEKAFRLSDDAAVGLTEKEPIISKKRIDGVSPEPAF